MSSSPQDTLDSVARDGVEEEKQKDGKEEDDNQFDDCPLVVVPDDVADGLQGIQEPHKRGIWPPKYQIIILPNCKLILRKFSYNLRWLVETIWIFSSCTSRILVSLLSSHQDQLSFYFTLY